MCVCVCFCVCEKEREKRDNENENKYLLQPILANLLIQDVMTVTH